MRTGITRYRQHDRHHRPACDPLRGNGAIVSALGTLLVFGKEYARFAGDRRT
jgi:hypothetical protein